ncbi:hypothetical protein M8453_23690 [Citrobacter freundii]|uniref:hypothetical protein n=1 Tax=Citrobacter freundii TaxID=546 RepID=UPI00214D15AF|nr:hypothetical protein [Citrobacter freundii]MCR3717541.1 hypothetical protein [Citrobacter freundii]
MKYAHEINAAGNLSQHGYEEALKTVEHLLEHQPDSPLVDILCDKISKYEDSAPELSDFNERIAGSPTT